MSEKRVGDGYPEYDKNKIKDFYDVVGEDRELFFPTAPTQAELDIMTKNDPALSNQPLRVLVDELLKHWNSDLLNVKTFLQWRNCQSRVKSEEE